MENELGVKSDRSVVPVLTVRTSLELVVNVVRGVPDAGLTSIIPSNNPDTDAANCDDTETSVLDAVNDVVVGSKVVEVSNAAPLEVAAEKVTEIPEEAPARSTLTVFGNVTWAFFVLLPGEERLVTRYVAAPELELNRAKVGRLFTVMPDGAAAVMVEGSDVSTRQLHGNVNVIVSFVAYSAFNRATTSDAPKLAKVTWRAAVVVEAATAATYWLDTRPFVAVTPPAKRTLAEEARMAPTANATVFF